ncbi:MAG: orotidine 5'-phosphate decarboxylase [Alphaproteobacteria bacterium]|nr:orotidine 5'-phosphate decarboxylase [Alphaproteobacteria bacterium]
MENIKKTGSFLCAGMDPTNIKEDEVYDWAMKTVNVLKPHVACFKPNFSFYEGLGSEGLRALKYICENTISILDIKAGDIGKTQRFRAAAVKKMYNPKFVTITDYMGGCALPFIELGIGTFVVARSTNEEGTSFQERHSGGLSNSEWIAHEIKKSQHDNMTGIVVGAGDDVEAVRRIRALFPDGWWLMPGVGTQEKPNSLKTLAYLNGKGIVNSSSSFTGVPDDMDWRSEDYDMLLIGRANELNARIGDHAGTTVETPKDIAVDILIRNQLALVSGYVEENSEERAFEYKNDHPRLKRKDFTTFCQIRHLTGVSDRDKEFCSFVIAEKYKKMLDEKLDAVVPVPMGAMGFLNILSKALSTTDWILRPAKEGPGNQDQIIGLPVIPKGALQRSGYTIREQEEKDVKILMVEDIFSSGGSSIKEADRLKEVLANHYHMNADISIIALGTNTLEAPGKVNDAGYKAYACIDIPDIAKAALKFVAEDEREAVKQDMLERFNVAI